MKIKLFQKSTKQKLSDQGLGHLQLSLTTVFANIVVTLSGLLLYLDKVFTYYNIVIPIPSRLDPLDWDQETFIWFITQTFTPILLIIAFWLKANKWFFLIPLYCYILQLHFNLLDYKIIDSEYLYYYAFGTTLLTVFVVNLVGKLSARRLKRRIQKEKERLLNEL